MIPPGWKLLDHVRLNALFGVRFWDAVGGCVVADRLVVEVFPKGRPNQRVTATANRSGVFSARRLPGLSAFETGTAGAPGPRDFVIEVTDTAGRFVPFAFTTAVPAATAADRMFVWERGTPMVPLFSAPGRAVPAGMAVVRAQLVRADVVGADPDTRPPAPWAVLEVTPPDGKVARGLADDRGCVAVVFPYPEPPDPSAAGPPVGPTAPDRREWKVDVRTLFVPGPPADRPDLRAALAQTAARMWADADRTTERKGATLTAAGELVLRTATTGSPPGLLPELFITTP